MQEKLLILIICMIPTSLAKIFSKCEVIFELRELGYPEHELKNLVCLIEMFRSHKVGGTDPYSTFDYELLHVHDHYWCNTGPFEGRGCDVPCSDLLLDDITIAASCAKAMLSHRNDKPWRIWEIFCRRVDLPHHGC